MNSKQRYNDPGHAHELTYKCHKRRYYFKDPFLCELFMERFKAAKLTHDFHVWAYVLMSNHVHLLIWPRRPGYDIAKIQKDINGSVSRLYSKHLEKTDPELRKKFMVTSKSKQVFRLFQPGGGFDRNMWSGLAVHRAIQYIENNPVRAGLVSKPEDWPWSSALTRATGKGLVPDTFQIPVLT